jgi:glutamate racemase
MNSKKEISTSMEKTNLEDHRALIGVFDSGVGGLSVLRALWAEMPSLPVIYLADQAHVPYGPRPLEQVRHFSSEISRWLIDQGAELIVVACNTASAAALYALRREFPEIAFVGMEPAVKPAAEQTHSGRVGVLATPATFQGELYASVVERFAHGVQLFQDTCPGLVSQIEAGELDAPQTRAILEEALFPMLNQHIDTVVLGCTHYPFVIPLIEEISGSQVRVIDPAPAVARQAQRLLLQRNPAILAKHDQENSPVSGHPVLRTCFFTSGDPSSFRRSVQQLLGVEARVDPVFWVAKAGLRNTPETNGSG